MIFYTLIAKATRIVIRSGVWLTEVLCKLIVTVYKRIQFFKKKTAKKMYKVEVDITLRRIIEIFGRIGIWRNGEESAVRKSSIRILYFLQYLSFLIYLLIVAYQAYLSADRSQFVFLVEAIISGTVVTVKLVYLLWRKDEVLNLLYDPNVTHCIENRDESLEVNQNINKIAILNKVYCLIMILTFFISIVAVLPTVARDEKLLPLFINFNLKREFDVILYWMTFIYISGGLALSVTYTLTMLFLWFIMFNYSIEYKLLGRRLKSLGTITSNTYPQELIHLIRAHNNLFE